ncbi:MAG: CBS domain-containing protein, partial [Nitrosopumilus sp.]|nr:CBS domain-containing protein [Nitrosopumilus sp.]
MITDPLERSVLSYVHGQFSVIDENVDVASAVKQIHAKNAETIIVSKYEKPIGIVTDSDILDKVVMRGADSDQTLLKSIMSSPIVTLSSKATVRQALNIMRLNIIKRVPIVDDEKVLGIVTQEGLANAIRTSVLEKTFRTYRVIIREHYKPILANLGFLLQFSGILIIAPAILATVMGETISATGMFLAITVMFLTGFILNAYGEKTPLNLKQASLLMVSSFVLLSLFGSIPYMYVNPFSNDIDPLSLFVNSFFESASGFTTTGLSFIAYPENLPQSFDFYRSFTQWVGGLSFVYLVITFFYPERKLIHMKGMIGGGILKLKQLLLTIGVIFTFYTVILVVLLYLFGNFNIVYAVSLVFSTVTGGGFVPVSTAVTGENSPHLLVIMAGMIISSLPFAFHYALLSKEVTTTKYRPEIFLYFGIIIVSIPIFYLFLNTDDDDSRQSSWLTSAFHVVSASTTSGFQFIDVSLLSVDGKIVLIILMLIGGTAFSTAGGIKVGRIIQIFQRLTKRNFAMDNAIRSISSVSSRYNESYISYGKKTDELRAKKAYRESLLVVALFLLLSFITALVLYYLEQKSFLDSLFESVSAVTTTGITAGITSMDMNVVSKIFLIVNMILGRF